MRKQRFHIIGYDEIPVSRIEPNPRNPRPTFHMRDDDPILLSMGESIKVDGQHNPATVYELVDHYDDSEEDRPGYYRLYQGESRWRACKIAGVEMLRCFVASTPKSSAEELEWMGNEDAFKREWQQFFVLCYAYDLAQELGVSVYSAEISTKTGVSMQDLKTADKLFRLEEPIQALVAEYEELMYEQLVRGERRRGTRLSGESGIRSKEFPVKKAALVYDVFDALRTYAPLLVKEKTDLELQQLIAKKATTSATVEDLEQFYAQLRQLSENPPTGLIAAIDDLLHNDDHSIRDFTRQTGAAEIKHLQHFLQRAPKLRKVAADLAKVLDKINDPDSVSEAVYEALEVIRDVNELERLLRNREKELRRSRSAL